MPCDVREKLQVKVQGSAELLFTATSKLAEFAGKCRRTDFITALRECRTVRAEVHSLCEQIVAHREQQGAECGTKTPRSHPVQRPMASGGRPSEREKYRGSCRAGGRVGAP